MMGYTSFKIRRVVWPAICLVIISAGALIYLTSHLALAADQKTWDDTSNSITVSNGQTINNYQYNKFLSAHESVTGNLNCIEKTLPLGSDASGMGNYDGCWYDTSLGLIEKGGSFIQPKGQPYAGLVNNAESRLFPTANSNVYAEITNPSEDYQTYYINFRTLANSQMAPTDSGWSEPFYSWSEPANYTLAEPDGSPLAVDDNLIASLIGYSNDGQWMSIWENQGFVIVVNLNSFNSRFITAEAASIALHDQDFATTTVSDGGHYLAVGIFGKPANVINLDNCLPDPSAVISGGEECGAVFLGAPLSSFTAGEVDMGWLPHFYEEGLLGTYGPCPSGVLHFSGYCEFLFRAPNSAASSYIALGDSYASGEGEGGSNFYPETDVQGVNMCHLAKNSYPFLIGKDLQLTSTHSVACSGAKVLNIVGNGIFDNSLTSTVRTNQYLKDVPGNTLGSWLPGYYSQTQFINDSKPSIVTISISGNDIGFKGIVERCLAPGTCYESYEDRQELVNLINNQFDKLVNLYASIKQSTTPDARIYVLGYPSIVKPDSGGNECGVNITLNKAETTFANQLEDYLNSVIRLAADKAGVMYVDDTNVFDGHRLCEAGQKAVNGITLGHDSIIVLSNGSFHPTVYGHELLAKWIERATNNFTNPMPRPDDSILHPVADPRLAFLQAEKTNRQTYEVVYLDLITNQYVYRSGTTSFSYTSGTDSSTQLKPFTTVNAELHSDPINLGTFTADAFGNFSGSITIPSDVPVGFHALNFYAMGVDGQMHEITQTIYVSEQELPAKPTNIQAGDLGTIDVEVVATPKTTNSNQPEEAVLSSDASDDGETPSQSKDRLTISPKSVIPKPLNIWTLLVVLSAVIILMVLLFIRYAKRQ